MVVIQQHFVPWASLGFEHRFSGKVCVWEQSVNNFDSVDLQNSGMKTKRCSCSRFSAQGQSTMFSHWFTNTSAEEKLKSGNQNHLHVMSVRKKEKKKTITWWQSSQMFFFHCFKRTEKNKRQKNKYLQLYQKVNIQKIHKEGSQWIISQLSGQNYFDDFFINIQIIIINPKFSRLSPSSS